MAAEAPTTGARSRAPRNPVRAVSQQDGINLMTDKARTIGAAAESIDAMILAVEVMIENQRRLMLDQNAGSFLHDNELWQGMAVLLTMVRTHAVDVGRAGEAIEVAGMRAATPAAA